MKFFILYLNCCISLTRDRKLLREMSDIPKQTSTVVPFVLASSFAHVIFVSRRRQLPEGFVAGVSAGFAIRFSCEAMSCARGGAS